MAANHAFDQAIVGEMVKPAILPVALTGGIDEGEITRLAGAVRGSGLGRQIQLLKRDGDSARSIGYFDDRRTLAAVYVLTEKGSAALAK